MKALVSVPTPFARRSDAARPSVSGDWLCHRALALRVEPRCVSIPSDFDPYRKESHVNYEDILQTEFSRQFVDGMRDRMVVSFHKYGPLADAYPGKVDATASLMDRLRLYTRGDPAKGIKPGNTEYLMDVANFAMIEFMRPRHPDAYFEGTDDSGSPGRVSRVTGGRDMRDNSALPSAES